MPTVVNTCAKPSRSGASFFEKGHASIAGEDVWFADTIAVPAHSISIIVIRRKKNSDCQIEESLDLGKRYKLRLISAFWFVRIVIVKYMQA